jgi:O-glycosyl hydrolase
MDWQPMRDFLVVLKDEFVAHNVHTQIWAFDHNFEFAKNWVAPLMNDPQARASFAAIAWHDYGGEPEDMGALHQQYPDIPMYLTERAQYNTKGVARIIRIMRNGAQLSPLGVYCR